MRSPRIPWPLWALVALLAAYGAVLWARMGAVPGGSDNSGYFNEARLMAAGRLHTALRPVEGLPADAAPAYLYVPLGFRPAAGGMVPTYSPGLPLMLVPAALLVGWEHAGDVVLLLHSLAAIALTFALGRLCGLRSAWALAGAVLLAASPLYLFNSLQALSDVPATAWVAAAVVAALLARRRAGWALASGAFLGVAFLVRPNDVLAAIPVALVLWRSPRRLLPVALAAAPFAAAWMAINHAAYGSSLESGYGAIGGEFHGGLVAGTLAYCARWLPLLLSPVVLMAPFAAAAGGEDRSVRWALVAWAAAYLGFFAPYRWTHEAWWFLRFLLPAAPALIVAGLGALQRAADSLEAAVRRPVGVYAAACLAAAVAVEALQTGPFREAWGIGRGERKYGRVAAWISPNLPRDAVLLTVQASGALFYYTDFTLVRWDQLGGAWARRVDDAVRRDGRPLYAVLFPFEEKALGALPGKWVRVGGVEDVGVWRRDAP